MSRVRPLVYGYVTHLSDTVRAREIEREVIQDFADREGYALGDVFMERDPQRPHNALVSLTALASRAHLTAIIVPSAENLGKIPRVQQLLREHIEQDTGVPVLFARLS